MYCVSEQNEKCSKGNDGEVRSHSVLSPRAIDEMLRGVERSGASMTFCHVQYNGKLTMERCSHCTGLLALNHFESAVTEHSPHTHMHTHSQM